MPPIRTAAAAVLALILVLGAASAAAAGPADDPADPSYVRAIHVDLLDREATVDDLAAYTGDPRAAVARDRAFGLENLTQEVEELYQTALDRAPDERGLAHWVNTMGYTPYPLRETVAQVYGSSEFVARIGHDDPESTVRQMFVRLLGHQPDQAGLDHWKAALIAHGGVYVVRRLYESQEHRRQRATEVFEEMLGRTPSPTDRDAWADRITGLGDIGLALRLALTSEYITRAAIRFPEM